MSRTDAFDTRVMLEHVCWVAHRHTIDFGAWLSIVPDAWLWRVMEILKEHGDATLRPFLGRNLLPDGQATTNRSAVSVREMVRIVRNLLLKHGIDPSHPPRREAPPT